MAEKHNLGVVEVLVGIRQHLVEGFEEELDAVPEAVALVGLDQVVVLQVGGADEEEPGSDD